MKIGKILSVCMTGLLLISATACDENNAIDRQKAEARVEEQNTNVERVLEEYDVVDGIDIETGIRSVLLGDGQWLKDNYDTTIELYTDMTTPELYPQMLATLDKSGGLLYYKNMYEAKANYFADEVYYNADGTETVVEKEWLYNDETPIEVYNTIGGKNVYTTVIAKGKLPCIIRISWDNGKITEFTTRIVE